MTFLTNFIIISEQSTCMFFWLPPYQGAILCNIKELSAPLSSLPGNIAIESTLPATTTSCVVNRAFYDIGNEASERCRLSRRQLATQKTGWRQRCDKRKSICMVGTWKSIKLKPQAETTCCTCRKGNGNKASFRWLIGTLRAWIEIVYLFWTKGIASTSEPSICERR